MEPTERKNRDNSINPERKYIRLQVVGMSFGLSIPPAMVLTDMFNLTAYIAQISALLFVVGCVFFFFGLVGRQGLVEKRRNATKSPLDCPK